MTVSKFYPFQIDFWYFSTFEVLSWTKLLKVFNVSINREARFGLARSAAGTSQALWDIEEIMDMSAMWFLRIRFCFQPAQRHSSLLINCYSTACQMLCDWEKFWNGETQLRWRAKQPFCIVFMFFLYAAGPILLLSSRSANDKKYSTIVKSVHVLQHCHRTRFILWYVSRFKNSLWFIRPVREVNYETLTCWNIAVENIWFG